MVVTKVLAVLHAEVVNHTYLACHVEWMVSYSIHIVTICAFIIIQNG